MRIVQIITELRPAGAERIVQLLSCGLRAAGHDVTVISLRPLPAMSFVIDRLRTAGIAIHSLELTKATPWRALRLKRLLRQLRPDLIHAHLLHANVLSRLLRLPGVPLVNTVHIAERRPGKGWHFLLDRWTLSRCTVQTCVSHAVAGFIAERLGRTSVGFPVIHNGIEPPVRLTLEEVRKLRREWGVDDCAVVIGSVGRLDWQKGYDQLLRVLPELDRMLGPASEIQNPKFQIPTGDNGDSRHDLQDENPPLAEKSKISRSMDNGQPSSPRMPLQPSASQWALVLLGNGPERARLERQAASLGLRNLVIRLPGFWPDADRAMGAFDLFVMPSRYEGFGLTLIEAMSHGLPVVASEVDSLPELLVGYPGGKMVSFAPGNEAAVAEMLFVMHLAASQRQTPSSGIAHSFTAERMTSEYLQLYQRLCP